MSRFIQAGYLLTIEPQWVEITTMSYSFDTDITERPATKEMHAVVSDEENAIKAVKAYFK